MDDDLGPVGTIFLLLLLVALFIWGVQTPGTGDFRGRVFAVTEEGFLCTTHEAQLITEVGGEHVEITLDDERLLARARAAQEDQAPVTIAFERPLFYWRCRTKSGTFALEIARPG